MSYRIDEIDEHILYHLAEDARNTTATEIAETVDVTPVTIRHRIKQLEEHGIIDGYSASIDYELAAEKTRHQFTCTAPVDRRRQLAADALAVSGVVDVRVLLSGSENLVVVAVGDDTADTARIARELAELGLEIEREDIVQSSVSQPYQPYSPDDDGHALSVADFRSLSGGSELVELTVAETAAVAGRTLEEVGENGIFDDEILLINVERGDRKFTPTGSTTIEPGDVITLFSREPIPQETIERFDGEPSEETAQ